MEEKVFVIKGKHNSLDNNSKTIITIRPNQTIVVNDDVEYELKEGVENHNILIIFDEKNVGVSVLAKHILNVEVKQSS